MYCANCDCEFDGWSGKCPICRNPLQVGIPPTHNYGQQQVEYNQLVDLINDSGGTLMIKLKASQVGKNRSKSFPYMGYGFAWTKRMQYTDELIAVDLNTTKIGESKKREFPYKGLGYAWRQEMQGSIGGNTVTLTAKKVSRKKSWRFPYFGFGYAWTEEMTGSCGDKIRLQLTTTEVIKKRRCQFPYFGFGYAWAKVGMLHLTLDE
jgi:hypothetical protein